MAAEVVVHLNGVKCFDNLLRYLRINPSTITFDKKKRYGVNEGPVITTEGTSTSGYVTVAKHLVNFSNFNILLGESDYETCAVDQWLDYCQSCIVCGDCAQIKLVCKQLNTYLADNTYFVNDKLTLADVMLYMHLQKEISGLTCAEKELLINLSRWFSQIQSVLGIHQKSAPVIIHRTLLY